MKPSYFFMIFRVFQAFHVGFRVDKEINLYYIGLSNIGCPIKGAWEGSAMPLNSLGSSILRLSRTRVASPHDPLLEMT